MADRISPAQKPVPRKDGFKPGHEHSTITTPTDNEGKVWNTGVEQTMSIFSKQVTEKVK